jgi:hypothetical protein
VTLAELGAAIEEAPVVPGSAAADAPVVPGAAIDDAPVAPALGEAAVEAALVG